MDEKSHPGGLPAAAPSEVAMIDLGEGIHCIDTGQVRPGMAAAYLIVRDGEAAFVECGANHSVPRLLGALEAARLERGQVRWVMPTHVHLDHAGGAGLLMRELPAATLIAHPRGAPHLIDPSKLWAGVVAVYGEAVARREYGELVPVPETRVEVAADGHRVQLGSTELVCIDTPGHARHHYSIYDPVTQGFFSGDTFGISYREFDTARGPFIMPTTTPVHFDPEAWRETLARYLEFFPKAMYLTHFSRVRGIEELAEILRGELDAYVALAVELSGSADRVERIEQALTEHTLKALKRHGVELPEEQLRALIAPDMRLNAQGLEVWLGRG